VSPAPKDRELRWFKSTRSAGNGACVEVASTAAGAVAVRDSKDPDGPMLHFDTEAWRGFVYSVQTGKLLD
jgi:hypothetical protein